MKEGQTLFRNRGLGLGICKKFAYHEPYEFECEKPMQRRRPYTEYKNYRLSKTSRKKVT